MTSYATVNPATGETLEEFPETTGAYMEATDRTDVTPEMRAHEEELFGPAAVVYKVSDANEAVGLANSSPFGLDRSVFSTDVGKVKEVADRLENGMDEFVNKKLIRHPAVKPSKPKN